MVPPLIYAGLCAGLSGFARRDQALAVGAGALTVALVWVTGTSLLRVWPVSPRQSPLLAAFTYGAVLEETVKLLVLAVLWRLLRPRGARDLLPLAVGIACGFAAAENVLALWGAAHPEAALIQRSLVTLPAHMAYGAILAIILARSEPPLTLRGAAVALPVVILVHGAYDTVAITGQHALVLVMAAAGAAFVAWSWWRRMRDS